MDTRRLRYFLHIVDAGSITRAAAGLGVAQPALSQQLAILEGEVRARLLDRSPSGVTPTAAGLKLYERASQIVRQVENLRLELSEAGEGPAGLVAVGLPPSVGAGFGAAFVRETLRRFPRVRLRLMEGGNNVLADQLSSGLIDIAILSVAPSREGVECEALFQQELLIVGAPDMVAATSSLGELARQPWVLTRTPNALRNILAGRLSQFGLEANVVAEVDSLPLVLQCVEAGLGLTLLPEPVVRDHLGRKILKGIHVPPEPLHRSLFRCMAGHVESEAVRCISELLKDIAVAEAAIANPCP
jgi:LysR family nitrogen assimilation transcriptional regulator